MMSGYNNKVTQCYWAIYSADTGFGEIVYSIDQYIMTPSSQTAEFYYNS